MPVTNLAQKFGRLTEYWTPETYGDVGNVFIKLVKVKGDYVWHANREEDKVYMVIKGQLRLKFRESADVVIDAGEFYVLPKNTEHLPTAPQESHVLLIEPKSVGMTSEKDSAVTEIFMPEIGFLSE